MDIIFGAVSREARLADINKAAHGTSPRLGSPTPDADVHGAISQCWKATTMYPQTIQAGLFARASSWMCIPYHPRSQRHKAHSHNTTHIHMHRHRPPLLLLPIQVVVLLPHSMICYPRSVASCLFWHPHSCPVSAFRSFKNQRSFCRYYIA
jgi:hypothetical protein